MAVTMSNRRGGGCCWWRRRKPPPLAWVASSFTPLPPATALTAAGGVGGGGADGRALLGVARGPPPLAAAPSRGRVELRRLTLTVKLSSPSSASAATRSPEAREDESSGRDEEHATGVETTRPPLGRVPSAPPRAVVDGVVVVAAPLMDRTAPATSFRACPIAARAKLPLLETACKDCTRATRMVGCCGPGGDPGWGTSTAVTVRGGMGDCAVVVVGVGDDVALGVRGG